MSQLILFQSAGNTFSGSYLLKDTPSEAWEKYRRNAARYLRATEQNEAIATLEYLPFTCNAVCKLNAVDDIVPTGNHLLRLRVPVEVFVEIETGQGNWSNRINEQLPKVAHALGRVGCSIWRVVAEVELDAENKPVEIMDGDELTITSETVEQALNQARTLVVSHGAPAALDRMHTVFHAYLKAACEAANVPMPQDRPGIVELLGLLKKHEMFVFEPELEMLVTKTLRGAQKSVDALQSFRNEYSLAHPQAMLPEPEALLVINLTQAILRYIDARLRR